MCFFCEYMLADVTVLACLKVFGMRANVYTNDNAKNSKWN